MDLEKTIDSKFRLAIIVARRAKQLINGAKPLVDIEAQNPLTIAIEEVKLGLVTMESLNSVNMYLSDITDMPDDEEVGAVDKVEEKPELSEDESSIEVSPQEVPEKVESDTKDPESDKE